MIYDKWKICYWFLYRNAKDKSLSVCIWFGHNAINEKDGNIIIHHVNERIKYRLK